LRRPDARTFGWSGPSSFTVCNVRPVEASQKVRSGPAQQQITDRPSAEKAQARTHPPRRTSASGAPVARSQTTIVPSREPPETTRLPSGEKSACTGRVACPAGVGLAAPVATSSSRMAPPFLPTAASVLPSPEKATQSAKDVGPLVRARSRPVVASQKRMEVQPTVANVLLSGAKATVRRDS